MRCTRITSEVGTLVGMAVDGETTWLGTALAARRMGITTRTLYKFIDAGELPAYKFGRVIRLKEHGVPHLRGRGRGDQQVRVRVAIPQQLTDEQRQLFEQLAQTFGDGRRGDGQRGDGKAGKGLFDRVKDVLGGD